MSNVSRESAPDVTDYGPAEDRGAHSDGYPPSRLRCWWARAAGDSSTTSEAQYSRRLSIKDR